MVERGIMFRCTVASLVMLTLRIAGAMAASSDGAHGFVYDSTRDPTGIVRHYVLTNHDGTDPEYISTFFPAADRIQAFKFHYGTPPAALVSAQLDRELFSPRQILSLKVRPGETPLEMARLEIDRERKQLVSHLPPLGIHGVRDQLPSRPFCVYPFDLLSLSLSLPHLESPEAGFSFDIVDANRSRAGSHVMHTLGTINCRHAGVVRRDGQQVHAFEVDGPDEHHLNGHLWIDAESRHLVEIRLQRPPNPNWSTFRLKFLGQDRFGETEWSAFQAAVLRPHPPLSERDRGWQRDIDQLIETLATRHANPSHTRPFIEVRAHARDLRHRVPRLSDARLAAEVQRILAMVGDGHTISYVGFGGGIVQRRLPIRFYAFADGLFIVAADPAYRQLVGCRVLRLGRQDVSAAIDAMEPYVSRDNPSGLRLLTSFYLTIPEFLLAAEIIESTTDIELAAVDDHGDHQTVTLHTSKFQLTDPRRAFDAPPGWIVLGGHRVPLANPPPQPFWFEEVAESGAVYCQLNAIRDSEESLDSFAQRLLAFTHEQPDPHLIIDLRQCQGGDNTKSQGLVRLLAMDRDLNRPDRLFVLVGRRTFSAAQNLATRLDYATKATFVGEPTGSRPNHYGETTLASLPYSGIQFSVSSRYWQDAPPSDDRPWIAPDIQVVESSADRAAGRDRVMQTVLRQIERARQIHKQQTVPQD